MPLTWSWLMLAKASSPCAYPSSASPAMRPGRGASAASFVTTLCWRERTMPRSRRTTKATSATTTPGRRRKERDCAGGAWWLTAVRLTNDCVVELLHPEVEVVPALGEEEDSYTDQDGAAQGADHCILTARPGEDVDAPGEGQGGEHKGHPPPQRVDEEEQPAPARRLGRAGIEEDGCQYR